MAVDVKQDLDSQVRVVASFMGTMVRGESGAPRGVSLPAEWETLCHRLCRLRTGALLAGGEACTLATHSRT